MNDPAVKKNKIFPVNFWFLVLLFLAWAPWLFIQIHMRMDSDAAWLVGAALKILDGRRMVDEYFDNNPPMSYLIFLPVALLVKLGIPMWHALNIFTIGLVTVALGFNATLLRYWPEIKETSYWSILASWLFAVMAMAHLDFTQKDTFIAIILLPFLLAQLMMTYRCQVPGWILCLVLLLGVPFLLIKPHFGLLPVVMLGFRVWKQKRWDIFRDNDFIFLTAGVLLYAMIIAIIFPDFLSDVLQISLNLYVFRVLDGVYPLSAGILLLSLCCTGLATMGGKGWTYERIMAVFLGAMSLLAGLAFLSQLKGFAVHLLPALSLVIPAMTATVVLYTGDSLQKRWCVPAAIIVFAVFGYMIFLTESQMPTHQSYAESSLAKFVKSNAAGSSFYLQADGTNIIVPVSIYTEIPLASRFSSLWFLPALEKICEADEQNCYRAPYVQYFSTKIAEDIRKSKPAFIGLNAHPGNGQYFLKVFGSNPEFQKEWRNYRKDGQFLLNYQEFFKGAKAGTVPSQLYDIYVRR